MPEPCKYTVDHECSGHRPIDMAFLDWQYGVMKAVKKFPNPKSTGSIGQSYSLSITVHCIH